MQVPETPQQVEQLALMVRLNDYAEGRAHWLPDQPTPGPELRQSCRALHTHLVQLVNGLIAPLLDRSTAREMETFTMHDRGHGRKVAHLMWQIIEPERRERLTPPEIGLLVAAAHLHDLGMTVSAQERAARLDPDSDLWDKLEVQERQQQAIRELRARMNDETAHRSERDRARRALTQAEEALLAQDTRERHATPERYREIVVELERLHRENQVAIPDIRASLAFDGQPFLDKLIEVCVSHNENAEYLVKRDIDRPRFPRDYPVGATVADLQLVAAALRLADILDFDRERTPPVLFHYLLPGHLNPADNRSVLEWSKHLAISNWQIEPESVVFRGRSTSHVIHHAVVQFCAAIAEEFAATRATFGGLGEGAWPFVLPMTVKADIHEDGYRYVPYRFELDDERIYELLMGGAIYDNPLVAVRELVQNAVDGCMLHDKQMQRHKPYLRPGTEHRIFVRYEEPSGDCSLPRLSVIDTGTGMDALVLERYFLKVGRSFYRSPEFNQIRVELRRHDLDFAPVSEFGIGFLSCFLLADRLIVETAPALNARGDMHRRTLYIDGPTRLIKLDEQENAGPWAFTGTKITLELVRGSEQERETTPPSWQEVRAYLEDVCQDLPYLLHLEHVVNGETEAVVIAPRPLRVELPPELEPFAYRIPVNDEQAGLEGEIVIINWYMWHQQAFEQVAPVTIRPSDDVATQRGENVLLRGGFKVGEVPGMPLPALGRDNYARLRSNWHVQRQRRYHSTNLARNATADEQRLAQEVTRLWMDYLVKHVETLPAGLIYDLYTDLSTAQELIIFGRYDAWTLYQLARNGWRASFAIHQQGNSAISLWEQCQGPSLELPSRVQAPFAIYLLNCILPRVSTLRVDRIFRCVKPPTPGWEDNLRGWDNWSAQPEKWSIFSEFVGETEKLLMDRGINEHLNIRFQERCTSFNEDELRKLWYVLRNLIDAREDKRPVSLTQKQAALFRRARETIGDLEVGVYGHDKYRIDSFEVPEE